MTSLHFSPTSRNASTRIIAEIGINHCGDMRRAEMMICAAKSCGAHMVKFQKRDIDQCYDADELKKPCDSPWGSTVRDKVRGRELSWKDFERIDSICKSKRIGWSASCFDLKSLVDLERRFGESIAFHKVPSCMSKHDEFLKLVASFQRLTLVSCGLAQDMDEVCRVASHFEEARTPYVLNVTTSIYPCPPERCHLNRIKAFRNQFLRWREYRHCKAIGYSGHEVGVLPSVIAAHLGARYVERHFTLDRSWYGADQSASLEPEGLSRLCRDIALVDAICGETEISLEGDEKNPVPNLRPLPDAP